MLSFSDIGVRLGGRVILDGASATLPPRARVGLVGRNGAGKTTLMRVVAGLIEPDSGSVDMPRGARIGYIAQDAPSGDIFPIDAVLAADVERAALLAEADRQHHFEHHDHDADRRHNVGQRQDPGRLGEIHDRLNAIDAHSAPARAARIVAGLGFDEAMQKRPLDSFSGGWKMRVALAALLFSSPDLLLLDEPSNHLDLEATMWLENFLKSCRATLLVISHERDLLNNVVDHILHLEGGRATLYAGGYDSFERQRAERLAQLESARAAQAAQRAKLQDYIARNSARASTAKQAQSRIKALARMQPIAAMAEDPSLSFDFPNPAQLRPPLVTLEMASVGYEAGVPVLARLNLRLDPNDRIALLGRNGNGKTTLARLLAAQLPAMEGAIAASGKMKVGYFTQYQVEELDADETPVEHMTRAMGGARGGATSQATGQATREATGQATPGAVRAQLGRFGFSGEKALTRVGKLSGGERARLALALITREAPHMLILDEPTNHLDVDSREALVQALNDYRGAVVIVSHDRHMIALTADRLVLVDQGTAREYAGTLDDYTAMVLAGAAAANGGGGARPSKKEGRKAAAEARERSQKLRRKAQAAEAEMAALAAARSAIDRTMFDPASADPALAAMTMTELMKERARIEDRIAVAEARWLEASEAMEAA